MNRKPAVPVRAGSVRDGSWDPSRTLPARTIALGLLGVALAASLCLGSAKPARAGSAARPPNIVLIISDDHGWRDYGFMGHPHVKTPNLDKLAAQGLLFPRGHDSSSLCCPSLGSILTGLYPHQSKITSNDPPRVAGVKPKELAKNEEYLRRRQEMVALMARAPALARLLRGLGFRSLQTGKWWWGAFVTGGFTEGMSHGVPAKGGRHGDAGLAIGRQTMQPVYDFLDAAKKDGKPFFLWYAPMLPHQPHNPPERLLAKYRDRTASPFEARYWAMIEWFDETCGQLLDYLDRQELAKDTIVIYCSDNGWIQNPKAEGSVRSKLTPYDAGHRTPLIVRWPARVKAGRCELPVSTIDIVPTLLHAVGLKPGPELQGLDLLDRAALTRRPAIFGECFTHDAVDIDRPASSLTWRWVIEGRWRLMVPDAKNVPAGKVQLHDIVADPWEEKDLAAQEPQQVEALRRRLDAWWDPGKK